MQACKVGSPQPGTTGACCAPKRSLLLPGAQILLLEEDMVLYLLSELASEPPQRGWYWLQDGRRPRGLGRVLVSYQTHPPAVTPGV